MVSAFSSVAAYVRFALLTASVLFVLALNHQAVSTLRVPAGGAARVGLPPKAAVVKQKVTLEATGHLHMLVAPAADAWLPWPDPLSWRPALRRALAVPRLRAGIRPAVMFCARLLGASVSPQAP
ncbi:hypothetical protein [Hymenobacter weizhouensis]|uniref:hypothetical protein n=1 Tax=Hymenobacter sp. YIM 151500-1 TaxID=2987689 RepID=UPI002227A812|nr:hypothetical protein [Hymenobacter sp. YIM 151500-1]UYZ63033.1 hypothetical protein OIS53_18820 [Hymenobacter sp. YIM 151500-1]